MGLCLLQNVEVAVTGTAAATLFYLIEHPVSHFEIFKRSNRHCILESFKGFHGSGAPSRKSKQICKVVSSQVSF